MTGAPNESAQGHEDEQRLAEMLAAVLEDNRYMTIATADAAGPLGLASLVRVRGSPRVLLGLLAGGAPIAQPRRARRGRFYA